jgi:hypothetical protein
MKSVHIAFSVDKILLHNNRYASKPSQGIKKTAAFGVESYSRYFTLLVKPQFAEYKCSHTGPTLLL